jgi:putative CocE/NonD family hydrolase
MIDLDTLYIRWFDTWLKHKDVGMDKIPHVRAFVTGINRWLNLSDWPDPEAARGTLYLEAGGSAQGPNGKGRLIGAPNKTQSPSVIDYDPSKAVVPDAILHVDASKATTDATSALKAPGTLLFETEPLAHAMAISGPYEVDLSFRTSARDTNFFVGLLDVDEKGSARAFGTSGRLCCSYMGGYDKPRPLVPGKIYVAKVEPWDSAHELKAGHRLALVISSDGFPMFARNLGTGEPIKYATRMLKQHNEIFHDAAHPSVLRFRVLWGEP